MNHIIAIANQKGGVAKTTTAVNLSASLAAMDQRVLLVDLDPQANATVGSGIDVSKLKKSSYHLLLGKSTLSDTLMPTLEAGYDIIPTTGDLIAADVELTTMMVGREQKLNQALQPIHRLYDYIIIDCPPALNMLTLNAMVAAKSVLIPMQCEYYAMEGLSSLLKTIEDIRTSVNPGLAIEGLLLTMYDPRNNLANEVSAQLTNHFGKKVYQTAIPRNVRLAEAPSYGVPVLMYDPNSRGALA
ncbi:MAG: ParA family protein [Gammaproteobacteria bacterium]|nr:ParA family protein [Gammaproteobacteria bacterium]